MSSLIPIGVTDAIICERKLQTAKYGENKHAPAEWLVIIERELQRAKDGVGGAPEKVMQQLVAVAATAITALEQHGAPSRKDVVVRMRFMNEDQWLSQYDGGGKAKFDLDRRSALRLPAYTGAEVVETLKKDPAYKNPRTEHADP